MSMTYLLEGLSLSTTPFQQSALLPALSIGMKHCTRSSIKAYSLASTLLRYWSLTPLPDFQLPCHLILCRLRGGNRRCHQSGDRPGMLRRRLLLLRKMLQTRARIESGAMAGGGG